MEFDVVQHQELKEYESLGLIYSTSDKSSKKIVYLDLAFIKVPSCNNHFEISKVLRDQYNGDVHISFGMTTKEEEEQIVSFLRKLINPKD